MLQVPPPPGDLSVDADMAGLSYEVTTWERTWLWMLLVPVLLVPVGAVMVLLVLAIAVILGELIGHTALGAIGVVVVQLLLALGVPASLWITLALIRSFFVAEVTVDAQGMQLTERRAVRRVMWAECEDVRRKGRKIEVMRDGEWQQLPSPNAATDARWLEDLIAQHIAIRHGDATAPPAAVTEALQAMREQRA